MALADGNTRRAPNSGWVEATEPHNSGPLPLETGTKLGQYEVQDYIGQGAMGLVYRAYHPQLERTAAVKILQAIRPDADTVTRFRHEARAIAKLRHQNIVDVYDFGEYQGTPYMIVEYVSGGSLADRMGQGTLDQAAALRYLRGIATGLDYAHEHGVVHRDIKPANVLLYPDDTPVLADFGLAKLIQGSSLRSMTGVTTGTPAYMSPEQVAGNQVGPATDRYALASIAYEMLTGVIPFDGEGLLELLYAQVHRQPLAPTGRNPALNPAVDAVIMRGLAKDPDARWETCGAFVDALTAALAEQTAPAVATMVMTPAVASTVPLRAAPIAPTTPMPAKSRAPAPDATAAIALPQPAPAGTAMPTRLRSRNGLLALGATAVIVILLLLVFGRCAPNRPALSLSPAMAAPGQTVKVKATHVPVNQAGDIQFLSQISYFPFRADGSGNVAADVTVPADAEPGDHTVKICWSGSCRASATLHVVAGVALATPTGNGSPSPTTSPSPSASPSSAASPQPGPTPTVGPTSNPTPPPPSPTPCVPIALKVPAISKLNGFTADFHCFAGGTWTVTVIQGGSAYVAPGISTASVPAGQTDYNQHFNTPVPVLSLVSAFVRACNGSRCYDSAPVAVGV